MNGGLPPNAHGLSGINGATNNAVVALK
jgi:hypothetical protein